MYDLIYIPIHHPIRSKAKKIKGVKLVVWSADQKVRSARTTGMLRVPTGTTPLA
jgi:hypothetical protein